MRESFSHSSQEKYFHVEILSPLFNTSIPKLLITCLPVTFPVKSAFGPTGKMILFFGNLCESLLSHLNLSI